ncbi:MAG: hypothetical protein GY930_06305 [bacterium]|nr:hypothetical protein [bacterium]
MTLTQSLGTPAQALPVEVRCIAETTGEPIPNARVLWLDAVTHLRHRDNNNPDWPYDPLIAVEEYGHTADCDGEGRIVLEAPLGGAYALVQTEELFAFQTIPSGVQTATIKAGTDVTLAAQTFEAVL